MKFATKFIPNPDRPVSQDGGKQDRFGEGSTYMCILSSLHDKGIEFKEDYFTLRGKKRWAARFIIDESEFLVIGAGIYFSRNGSAPRRIDGRAVSILRQKDLTKSILRTAGVSVPEGASFYKSERGLALRYYKSVRRVFRDGVCIKPNSGGLGIGITVGVADENEFRSSFLKSAAERERVLVEELVTGPVYRIITVGRKAIAARIGRPKNVIGDGNSTIHQLIEKKNERKRSNALHRNFPLSLGEEELGEMRRQGLSIDSVVEKGHTVFLGKRSNRHAGAEVIDCTDALHPSYLETAARAASAIPDLVLCGVDIIIPSPDVPASPKNHAILEMNTGPGFADHHFPWEGKPRNVAGELIDYLRLIK